MYVTGYKKNQTGHENSSMIDEISKNFVVLIMWFNIAGEFISSLDCLAVAKL